MYREITTLIAIWLKTVHVTISYTWYSDASKLKYSLCTPGQYTKHLQLTGDLPVNPGIFEWPQTRWKKLKLACNTTAPSSLHWWSQLWSLTTAGLSPNLQLWRQMCFCESICWHMYSIGMSEGTHFYKNFNSSNVWMTINSRKNLEMQSTH